MSDELDELCINTVRFLSVDAVQLANSGHPGLSLGAAPMAYVLWTRLLRHNPTNPHWFNRDRFVLSAGHGSMLLYSLLHLTGYNLPLEQIKQFRQWGRKCPGHPERQEMNPALSEQPAEASALRAERDGQTFCFCGTHCQQKFLSTSAQSIEESGRSGLMEEPQK